MRATAATATVLACIIASVSACGSSTARPPATPTKEAGRTAMPLPAGTVRTARPEPIAPGVPVIVQIENTPEARPQSGLSGATIVYQYVAEGGISRLSAVFAEPPQVMVGPVRSARLATVQITKNLQGVLAYSGASAYINGQLAAAGVPHYDEDSAQGNLFRINGRYPPHNLYTDGSHLAALIALSGAPVPHYTFWPGRAATAPGGRVANSVTVTVSQFEIPLFTWDGNRGGYVDHESDGLMIDADTHNPVVAATLIVQQVPIAPAPQVVDVNGVMGVSHNLAGGPGNAQVFTGGQEYDANWNQPPGGGPPQFTLPGGAPAPINAGLVWIALVPVGGVAGFQ